MSTSGFRPNEYVHGFAVGADGSYEVAVVGDEPAGPVRAVPVLSGADAAARLLDCDSQAVDRRTANAVVSRLALPLGGQWQSVVAESTFVRSGLDGGKLGFADSSMVL